MKNANSCRFWKRIIALFMSLIMALAIIPTAVTAVELTSNPNILEYSENSGSSSFVISSRGGMAAFSQLAAETAFEGKTVYLACDIDMSGLSYTPFKSFKGTFDGRGYALKGISISTSGTSSGVFAAITSTAVIKNLGVVGGKITAACASDSQRAGSIVGVMNGGSVENCYSTAEIIVSKVDSSGTGDLSAGGIAGGTLSGGTIKNCYFAGSVTGVDHASGISDWAQGQSSIVGKMINCYNIGNVNAPLAYGIARYSGSITEANKAIAITNCYYLEGALSYSWAASSFSAAMSQFASGEIAYKLDGGSSASRTRVWHQGELFPELSGDTQTGTYKLTLTTSANGVSSTAVTYANAGSKLAEAVMPAADTKSTLNVTMPNILEYDSNKTATAYVITTASGFTKLSSVVNAGTDTFAGKSIYMMSDIDMSSISNHTPIGIYISGTDWTKAFSGSFYGGGHKVLGLIVNQSTLNGAGLFGVSYQARFEGLGVYGSVSALNRAGGITGYGDKTTFVRCFNGASVTTTSGTDGCGGISGVSRYNSTFTECFNIGTINAAETAAGGISGWGQDNVILSNCYNYGNVSAPTSYTALSRVAAEYTNQLTGCIYLSSACLSLYGGTDTSRNAFANGYGAWYLNTSGGTETNSGAYTSTPLCPALCTGTGTAAVMLTVNASDENGSSLGTTVIYANTGVKTAPSDIAGKFTADGIAVTATEQTVNAVFKAVKHNITYTLNGGALANTSKYASYSTGSVLTLPSENEVTRSGFIFAGWYTAADYSGDVAVCVDALSSGNKTYYAKWATKSTIKTADELVLLAKAVNGGDNHSLKYISLANDINMSGVSIEAIGTSAAPFCGVFNGNGYKITKLAVNQGIFGYIKGAIIKNVILDTCKIGNGTYTGSIAGTNKGGAIVNCGSNAEVTAGGSSSADSFSVMSFNIKVPGAAPYDIATRGTLVKQYLTNYSPDIIGFQEVSESWYSYVNSYLPGYSKEFVYRAASSKEAAPVYWKTAKFNCLEQGTFWLSETPATESKGWDAAYYRTCSYAVLVEKTSGNLILFYNTHLDVTGSTARYEGAKLIISRMQAMHEKYRKLGYSNISMFCTGDFNSQESSNPYLEFSKIMKDAKYVAEDLQTPLTQHTLNSFGQSTKKIIIDFIFADTSSTDILTYKVTTEQINNLYISDHYGLFATASMTRKNAGGIVGLNDGVILNTYFIGSITANMNAGGIAGINNGAIISSYSVPKSMSDAKYRGGIAGTSTGVLMNTYYPLNRGYKDTGLNTGTGAGTVLTEEQMKTSAFASKLNLYGIVWRQNALANNGYPFLAILSSHKIVLTNAAKYTTDGNYLKKVPENTTRDSLVSFIVNDDITVTADKIVTGSTVVLKDTDGTVLQTLTVIVTGDVDCDGKVTNNDYVLLKSSLKASVTLTETQKQAADTNASAAITSTDYLQIKRHITGSYIL